jgi:hypothetical protein
MRIIPLLLSMAAAVTLTYVAETFNGVITDTMCGAKPHTDSECVKMCIKGPYVYALNDGATVMKLSDQKTSAQYAARRVKVTGIYDEKSKTIRVSSIEPLEEK